MIFSDRHDAGRQLAAKLKGFAVQKPIIFALPRGGVPIGFEVARKLDAPLDVILVRKLGHPISHELAIGAVAEGAENTPFLDDRIIAEFGISPQYVTEETERQRHEIDHRRQLYAKGRRLLQSRNRVAIVVDDGVATGSTMIAAVRAIRRQKPSQVIVAVPVGAASSILALQAEADDVICLEAPEDFAAVGEYYRDFRAIDDREVIGLLEQSVEFGAGDQP